MSEHDASTTPPTPPKPPSTSSTPKTKFKSTVAITAAAIGKKIRRKHKNSKMGCIQCKDRRMKCNEEIPECRNCRVRQVKIPCSYLSFTDQDRIAFIKAREENQRNLEEQKKQYLVGKEKLKGRGGRSSSTPKSFSTASSPDQFFSPGTLSTPSFSIPSNDQSPSSSSSNSHSPFVFRSIRHVKQQSPLKSQMIKFLNETDGTSNVRQYFIKLLGESYFRFEGSFNSHFAVTAFWVHIQLQKKYRIIKDNEDCDDNTSQQLDVELANLNDVGIKYLHSSVSFLRRQVDKLIKAQDSHDYKIACYLYAKIVVPSFCLQSSDILRENNLKIYYFDGWLKIVNEFLKRTPDVSPLAMFAASATYQVQKSLFIPNYSHKVLFEIQDTLREFQTVVQEREPNDAKLRDDLEVLIHFLQKDVIEFLESDSDHMSSESVLTHSPKGLFTILFKFFRIIPSESFTIDSTLSLIHKVFYTFYYAIGCVLDNIFPDARYLTQYRFIGPTTIYPFDFPQLRNGLDPQLLLFANYFLRLLAFFTRRGDFFTKYMIELTLFPDNLGEYRFRTRKAKIHETFISEFKKTVIGIDHYPRLYDNRFLSISSTRKQESSDSPLSTNLNTGFGMNLSCESDLDQFKPTDYHENNNNNDTEMMEEIDLLDMDPASGFLNSDCDPLLDGAWVEVEKEHAKTDPMSLQKYIEDREILMRSFVT